VDAVGWAEGAVGGDAIVDADEGVVEEVEGLRGGEVICVLIVCAVGEEVVGGGWAEGGFFFWEELAEERGEDEEIEREEVEEGGEDGREFN
jgi:hypothetical protein